MYTSHISTLAFLVGVLIFGSTVTGNSECLGEDYSPCSCYFYDYNQELEVTCPGVSMSDVASVFNQTTTVNITSLELHPQFYEDPIQEDFLAGKFVYTLTIQCDPSARLVVDLNAFRSSSNFTTTVVIEECDLAMTDFRFLTDFNALTHLTIGSNNYLHLTFRTLPSLSSLTYLDMNQCHSVNQLVSFPNLTNGLTVFKFRDNQLDLVSHDTLVRVLDWILLSSKDTLSRLMIDHNRLTKSPSKQISSFNGLRTLDMSFNSMPIIRNESFHFNGPVESINLRDSLIETLEPASFNGYFGNATIDLSRNVMTRFEAPVFQSMLEEMVASEASSYIDIFGNPIDCTEDICHLKWLIVDDRNLLGAVRSGRCSNGIAFDYLGYALFENCTLGEVNSTTTPEELTSISTPSTSEETEVLTTTSTPSGAESAQHLHVTSMMMIMMLSTAALTVYY